MNRNTKFQYIKQILYDLKKLYGFPIVLYNITSYVVSTTTGLKTVSREVFPIPKAIVLATSFDVRYKALLGVQKDFAYGGQIAQEDRYFVIDRKYIPKSFVATDDCYITYDNKRYDVVKIQEYEYLRAIIILGKHVKNASINQIIPLQVNQNICLKDRNHVSHVWALSHTNSINLIDSNNTNQYVFSVFDSINLNSGVGHE